MTEDEMVGWHHHLDGHEFEHHTVKSYTMAFSGCTSLKSIGHEAIDCAYVLNGAVKKNASIANLFPDCTALETVPSDFMINADEVTSVYNMFKNCSSLKSFPVSAFDNLTLLTIVKNLFDGCTSLTGESPYTVVNGVKYHLYERTSDNAVPSGFKAVTQYEAAFRGCTGLSDYSKIDGTWK